MKKTVFFIVLYFFMGCSSPIDVENVEDPVAVFEAFWKQVDRNFSFFGYLDVDWYAMYDAYRPQVQPTTTDYELFKIMGQMLDSLKDAHTQVYAPMGTGGNTHLFRRYSYNTIDDMRGYFTHYAIRGPFEYGTLKEGKLGYVKINTFEGELEDFEVFDSIVGAFAEKDGLVIDVRSNKGGLISNVMPLVGILADSLRMAYAYRYRNGTGHDDFSAWKNSYVAPNTNGTHFTKDVVILTNRFTYSAAELFVLSACVFPQVTVVGDTTGGGSGRPIVSELPNGWLLRVANSQTRLPSGKDFQFVGLYPDIPIWITREEFYRNVDAILEQGIKVLS